MMKKILVLMLFMVIFFTATESYAQPVLNPANGHYYEVVINQLGTPWSVASTQAASMTHLGMQGYLATITSDQERDFINSLDWHSATIAWIGGSQLSGQSTPNIGWQWITGEPFTYNGWEAGEPNDNDGSENSQENCIENQRNVGWNDQNCNFEYLYFIVEFGDPTAAIPTMTEWGMIIFVVLAGLGSVYFIRRKTAKC